MPFSADGRWFHGRRILTDRGLEILADIFSTITGDLVLSCNREGYACTVWSIAPDGSTAAVKESARNGVLNGVPDGVCIVELPSGKEICRFDLPFDLAISADHWDGVRLHTKLTESSRPRWLKAGKFSHFRYDA